MRWSPIASALAALAIAASLLGAPDPANAASPTGYWKLSLRIDYTSSGTATNSRCYPDPEQAAATAVSGSATQRIAVRTVRPAHVEFHAAPNGVPVAAETTFAKASRAKVSETRGGNIATGGEPQGCYGGAPPPASCGTKSVLSGLYVNPLGGIHSWKGFTLQLQDSPGGFGRCGLTGAQGKLADPLTIDVVAKPGKLTGKAAKLVFRGSEKFSAADSDESTKSTATGEISWTVTLRRAGVYG